MSDNENGKMDTDFCGNVSLQNSGVVSKLKNESPSEPDTPINDASKMQTQILNKKTPTLFIDGNSCEL